MESNHRLKQIAALLSTALDDEEEYIHEGEMSYYPRSYAADAAGNLRAMIQRSELTAAEIDLCLAALSDPERIARGSSEQLLVRLGGDCCLPLLEALAGSSDARLRIFALKTGYESSERGYDKGLCPTVTIAARLLDDPDEDVRLAAASTSDWMRCNTQHLERSLHSGADNPIVRLFHQFLALLDDPSAKVRAAAAEALGCWAAGAARDALAARLEREEGHEAKDAL